MDAVVEAPGTGHEIIQGLGRLGNSVVQLGAGFGVTAGGLHTANYTLDDATFHAVHAVWVDMLVAAHLCESYAVMGGQLGIQPRISE